MATRALTAEDLNAVVFRYLQESGFVHTAFNFFHEARLGNCDIEGKKIPVGALITIFQKGLQYTELEANSEVSNDEEFHFFEALDLLTKDVDELKKDITKAKKIDSNENAIPLPPLPRKRAVPKRKGQGRK